MFLFEYEIEKGKKKWPKLFFLDESSKCITLSLRLGNRKKCNKRQKIYFNDKIKMPSLD